MIKQALIHVENMESIVELSKFLSDFGWKIYSANKTEELLKKEKIPVTREQSLVDNIFHQNDISILNRRLMLTKLPPEDNSIPYQNEEGNIFLVCMNVNPIIHPVPNAPHIKNISSPIGYYVTTLLRTAFLNYQNILILTDPADYKEAMIQLRTDNISEQFRFYLAGKAMNMVSACDSGIATSILASIQQDFYFMNYLTYPFKKQCLLSKGLNQQQEAALYKFPNDTGAISGFVKYQGKDLNYNIVTDVSLAWEQISALYDNLKTQVAVKSKNCDGYEFTTQLTPLTGTVFTIAVKFKSIVGAALSTNVHDSFVRTYTYDTENIKDVTLGCSAVIDQIAAEKMAQCNFSAIIAPDFTPEAKHILSANHHTRLIPTSRILEYDFEGQLISGGLILQTRDTKLFNHWYVKTKNRPSQAQTDELAFSMLLAKGARSYSVLLLKQNSIVGIAQGCTSVVNALELALIEAQKFNNKSKSQDDNNSQNESDEKIADILVCDSTIPFCDSIKKCIDKGISAIIQTGNSNDDKAFIDYCNEHDVTMVFTDMTHLSF
ncbi:MAG: hypothetical protein K5829_05840 [Treponema sp.]|nr:hypothetical protein [Treponema sp.]